MSCRRHLICKAEATELATLRAEVERLRSRGYIAFSDQITPPETTK